MLCNMKASEETAPIYSSEMSLETPLGRTIRLLGDMWVLLIVMNLLPGCLRFNALRSNLGHISSKTLSSRLKILEELGVVQRVAFLEIPPRVEYHLTDKGREMGAIISALEQFGNKHLSQPLMPRCETHIAEENALGEVIE